MQSTADAANNSNALSLISTLKPGPNYITHKWWKEAIVYQIYPASFKSGKSAVDTDGWGDVKGIIERVLYLRGLGVDVLWLSPNKLDD